MKSSTVDRSWHALADKPTKAEKFFYDQKEKCGERGFGLDLYDGAECVLIGPEFCEPF